MDGQLNDRTANDTVNPDLDNAPNNQTMNGRYANPDVDQMNLNNQTGNVDVQQQLREMQNLLNLQMQAMQLQSQMFNNPRHPTLATASITRQVKVPERVDII